MVKKNIKQNGGDGYVVNVNESIGGRPSFARYSDNYRPIFDGELLQNDGNNYSNNDINECKFNILNGGGSKKKISMYKFLKMQSGGDCGCSKKIQSGGGGCGCSKIDTSIFDLIKLKGGFKEEKVSQFHAIRELSSLLTPLSTKSLLSLNSKIFLNHLSQKKSKKYTQYGGFSQEFENILAPLGKNNLIVISALLLLHYFAVESKENIKNKKQLKGGNSFNNSLSEILAPLGINAFGTSVLLIVLQKSFTNIKNNKKILSGGNPLKNIIAPLGTNAFIATGLLLILEKIFINKINESKTKEPEKKKLIGGKINKNFEKLFNVIAPITFNIFAKKSFLEQYAKNTKK